MTTPRPLPLRLEPRAARPSVEETRPRTERPDIHRTELRFGETAQELQRELDAHPNSMLVLGTSDPGRIDWSWLGRLLESQPERPVLIVNAHADRPGER